MTTTMKTRTIAAALVAAALGLATGCGSAGTSTSALATPAPSSATPTGSPAAAPNLSSADISTDLQTVLSDLKSSDAQEQEAWVTNGHSEDLQQLINDTSGATGSTQLDEDAATFNADASGYLSDQTPYLYPGWETEYHQVRLDINALATDCALTPVLAPPGTS